MGRVDVAYRGQLAPDALIAELAGRQHGVVARWQLLGSGVSSGAIDRRVAARRLHVLHRGVYAVGHRAVGYHGRLLAAVLSCGRSAVLSHRSAAALWEVMPRSRGPLDITVPGRAGRARTDLAVHRPRVLPRGAVAVEHGIPVTTPSRTLADLKPLVRPRELERATEQAVIRRLIDDVAPADTLTRSELEEIVLNVVRRGGLPEPRCNLPVLGASGRWYTCDFAWPEARLVVETDGRRFHGTAAAFERDRARDADLLLAGHRVVRLTYRQAADETYVRSLIARLLEVVP